MRLALLLVAAATGLAGPARSDELAGKTLAILARPDAQPVVAGEMVPIVIRGVYDRKIAVEKLAVAPSETFDWIQLAQDDWHMEMIGGVSRLVMERHIAAWPKVTGLATFGPADHILTVINADSQREEVTVHARPLELSVAPMPDGPPFKQPYGWRFSAARLTLTDELSADPARLVDGQTVTRRVTLRAEGALPEMLPPRPVVQEPWLITFAAPVERRMELTPDGPISTVIWTWQFRPETGEPGVLAPVPIPFFNTRSRKVEKVEIPALPIGYASFKAAQTATGRLSAGTRLAVAGVAGGGLLLGLAVQIAGTSGGAGWWRRLRHHYSPMPLWRLRQAARTGNLLDLRRAAELYLPADAPAYIGRWPALRREILQPLDTAIYAAAPEKFDAESFIRTLRAARRGR